MDIKNKKFHFIAIGGVGMSGLAKYLYQKGAYVTGSDVEEGKYTHLLQDMGIKVNIGHDKNLITGDMIVVASTAIKSDNPEIMRAKELGLKIWHRSDILKLISDEFSQNKEGYFIGFSGTHGKTTTSGLASYVMLKGDLKPSFVSGGIVPEYNTNAEFGGDKYFIAELDESDGTISKYSTDIAVINNMDEDHLDHYKNGFIDIAHTFNEFLSLNPGQKVIINKDNSGNREFMKLYPDYNFITFGLNDADYEAKNIEYHGLESVFDIYYKGEKTDTIKLSVPGEHNVYNALAVYSALKEADINMSSLKEYFYTFSGMGRRFQKVCEFDGIKIYDDYAHHPGEIKTTLKSVKNALKNSNRIVEIFQPHRYSRLKGLWNQFKQAFSDSDMLIITDVYPAGENPIEGINSGIFSKDVNHKNNIYIQGNMEECAKKIYPLLKNNDIVLTMGAGSITKLGKLIEQEYKRHI